MRRAPWNVTFTQKDLARFWASVSVGGPDECWPCTSLLDTKGRPRFYGQRSFFKASHVIYYLQVGRFQAATLDHLCHNVCCVNPRHLDPVSQAENSRRAHKDGLVPNGQALKTKCIRGHPLSGDNLGFQHIKGDPPGTQRGRQCLECRRVSQNRARARYNAKLASQ